MATSRSAAVVLGGDLEALTAAALLARAGRRVVLVTDGVPLGGAAAAFELAEGFRVPGLLAEVGGARRKLLAPLELERHGLAWERSRTPVLLAGERDAPEILLQDDPARFAAELPADQRADGDAYGTWRGFLDRVRGLVTSVCDEAPPPATALGTGAAGVGELLRLAGRALAVRQLGEKDMFELLRVVPMAGRDWMHERFGSPLLRAGLLAPALEGTPLGPRAAGTAALLLLRECAIGAEPEGGAPALAAALLTACRSSGVELREVRAGSIELDGDGVCGLTLPDGTTLETRTLVSCVGLRRTVHGLLPPRWVTDDLARAADAWRCDGTSAVLCLALARAPELRGRPAGSIRRARTAVDLDHLERAADALKYGELPAAPWLDVQVSDGADRGAVLRLRAHGVPRSPATTDVGRGWSEPLRASLEERMLASLEDLAPGSRDALVAKRLLTPAELESDFGLEGGHLHGGELALDQLWLQRPSLPLSRQRCGIPGLVLGGSAQHPSGLLPCGAGALAAAACNG